MIGKKINSLNHKITQGVRHFSGCFSMTGEDILLCSFPRSGSTWFRTVFANCLHLKNGHGKQATMVDLESVMPVLGYSKLGSGGADFYKPRLIKTHRLASEIKPFRPKQVFHLWREPIGVMKSCFRYYSAHRGFKTSDLQSFIRDDKLGMAAWKKHFVQWQPVATVSLEYNCMRDDTVGEVSRVLGEMGYDELLPLVAEAVEMASLANMKKSEKQGIRNPERFNEGFASIGGAGSDSVEFSDSDLHFIESMSSDLPIAG